MIGASARNVRRTRIAAVLLAACCLMGSVRLAATGSTAPFPVAVKSTVIGAFHIGRDETRFGPLEFVGGLEMTSGSRDFGANSAFRFLKPGSDFIGVDDTGFWFFGRIERDAAGRPSGIADFTLQRMVNQVGNPILKKADGDAEGLDVEGDIATVGFERNHRVLQFRIDPKDMRGPSRQLDFLVPRKELRMNRGFETVTRGPHDASGDGPLVVVSENSLDEAGNILGAIIEGPDKGVFTVKRGGDYDITDGAFLPDGDLLILERKFSWSDGIRMRLRRLAASSIAKGSVADGPVLLEADMGYQIDNMEAMDVWTRADGATIVSLMSDDNHSILQRNLYLEFVLHDQ